MSNYKVTTLGNDEPVRIEMEGNEVVEKEAKKGGKSGRIYVPKHWIGKKVRAVLIESDDE